MRGSTENNAKLSRQPLAKIRPTALEFLQQSSEQLWREPSYKGLLKCFVSILKDTFGAFSCGYFEVMAENRSFSLRPGQMRFPQIKLFEEAASVLVQEKLRQLISSSTPEEMRQGVQHLLVGDVTYLFVRLTDPQQVESILVWSQPPLSHRSPVLRQIADSAEFGTLALLDFMARQVQAACQWYRKLDETQAQLYRDELTGLFNYRYLDIVLDSELRRLHRFESSFCVLFIDLDHFKEINDHYGHLAGSALLKSTGKIIHDCVRDVDCVIRYGGDEYIVILLGANITSGMLAAERIRARIASTEAFFEDFKEPVKITASIGVACCPDHGRDKATLLRLADETMYSSKRGGRNRITTVSAAPAPTLAMTTTSQEIK